MLTFEDGLKLKNITETIQNGIDTGTFVKLYHVPRNGGLKTLFIFSITETEITYSRVYKELSIQPVNGFSFFIRDTQPLTSYFIDLKEAENFSFQIKVMNKLQTILNNEIYALETLEKIPKVFNKIFTLDKSLYEEMQNLIKATNR
jgi:hypothetical protein